MKDVLGQAIHDHYHQLTPAKLWINNRYGPKEEMPVDVYFRDEDDMPDLEWVALNECRGNVLDVGAGAGSHALELQNRGYDVLAMDISPLAVAVMKERGVKETCADDIFKYSGRQFDTILLLMNGIGLAGTVDGLSKLLEQLKTLLAKGGQIIFDSSDVAYLYEGDLPTDRYHGEITYQYEYKGQRTDEFNWLYIDEQRLTAIVAEHGFDVEVLYEDEHGQYLTRLTLA